jgi:Family of unknown function (DUF5684)
METSDAPSSGMAAVGTGVLIVYLAILVLLIASWWKIFTKAGKPGWAAIVPIYNLIVFLEIVGKPTWWIILLLIPFVNFIILIILIHRLSLSFGQGVGFTILLIVLGIVGYPMLAFGSSTYVGPPKD